jgi:hypothetical protein
VLQWFIDKRYLINFLAKILSIYIYINKQESREDYITRSFTLCTPHKILFLKLAGHVARKGERGDAYRDLVGKSERRPLGRPRHSWEDNIKMYLREIGWGGHGLDQSGSG